MTRYTETWYGQTRVRVYHKRPHVLTQLPCGHIVRARPHDTPDYEIRAKKLGYPDGASMNAEHDLTHAAIAWILGLPLSPALDAAKHGRVLLHDVGSLEEDAVFALARYACALRRVQPAAARLGCVYGPLSGLSGDVRWGGRVEGVC